MSKEDRAMRKIVLLGVAVLALVAASAVPSLADGGWPGHGGNHGGPGRHYGHYDHGWHGRPFIGGVFFGTPLFARPWYAAPPIVVGPPVVYAPPAVVVTPPPPVYAQPPAPAEAYWFYCREARAYYPQVQQCPSGWVQVAPQPQ
jgi:hypothetical protein